MKLYEIDERIEAVFEACVDPETGEIVNEEAFEALNALQMERDGKIEGILLWIKNLAAEAEALKREKMAFAARQAATENKVESLKKYITAALEGKKFSTERVCASFRKSESVEYVGTPDDLPERFLRFKAPELDKAALKAALKGGEVIPGAALITRQNLQIK